MAARIFKGENVASGSTRLRPGTLTVDTSTLRLKIHDGITAGGVDLFDTASDYPVTNQYYVDPARTDSYSPTGTIDKPFKSITAAQAAIEAAITAGKLSPAETSPVFIILCSNTTENVTLSRGHVFLMTNGGGIHTPIYFFGTITISGSNTSTSALDINHFGITGMTINAPAQKACIYFTGANAQRLMLKDCWLTATGNQTGSTDFTDAGGFGIYADCTGVRASDNHNSVIHGNDIKISHNGTGDVYCFKIGTIAGTAKVSADFTNVETSGATQVGEVSTGCSLSFTGSELDANGETCLEAYGTGSLVVSNSLISNAATGVSYGIWLHQAGGNATVVNSVFSVASSNSSSRAVHGVTGTVFVSGNIMIGKNSAGVDYNAKIDTAITRVAATVGLTAV